MRRLFRSWIAFFLFLSVAAIAASAASARNNNTKKNAVQDPLAVATIQAALAALGGTDNIALIQNSVVQGTSVDTPDDGSGPATFIWSYSGSDFRNENDAATGSHILLSNAGNPCDIQGTTVTPFGAHVARANLPFHIPGLVLLNEISNLNYTLTYIGPTTINGTAAIEVDTADNSDSVSQVVTPQQWYFDPNSNLSLQVQYRVPDPTNAQAYQLGTMAFSNYQATNNVLVPFQLTLTEGPITSVATVTSVAFNTSIGATEFTCIAQTAERGNVQTLPLASALVAPRPRVVGGGAL